jgi:hypothetical protein
MAWRPGAIFPTETCWLPYGGSALRGPPPKFNGPIPIVAEPVAEVSKIFPGLPQAMLTPDGIQITLKERMPVPNSVDT